MINRSGKIENREGMKKWEDRKYFIFAHLYVWLEEWKIGEMKNFFSLVEKKNGRIKNVICINLLSYSY